MKNSKLLAYLKTFNREDKNAFLLFLKSPYFNKKEELVRFYEVVISSSLDKDSTEENSIKQEIYEKLFKEKKFDDKHFGYLMSDLSKLIERYFQIKKYESEALLPKYHHLESLLERNLIKYYQQQFQKVSTSLEAIKVSETQSYLNKYLIFDTAVQFHISQSSRNYDENHQLAANNLDNFYFARKLRYCCSMLNNQNILARNYDLNFLEEIKTYLQKEDSNLDPCIEMYLLTANMLGDEEDIENFKRLKSFIFEKIEQVHPDDALYIYISAINYCARRTREGKRFFAEEALNFYLHGLENEILFEEGILSEQNYKNIIGLGLAFKSSEWVEQFIKEYNSKLPPKVQENALHFNLANLYYHRKDYDNAITHLNYIKFTDLSYNFGTKVMLMRIYYELDEEDPLLSLLASFSLYLKRNKKVSRDVKQPYLNFCTILNKIMRRNPKKLEKIKSEIKTSEYLTARSWLYKIIDTSIR